MANIQTFNVRKANKKPFFRFSNEEVAEMMKYDPGMVVCEKNKDGSITVDVLEFNQSSLIDHWTEAGYVYKRVKVAPTAAEKLLLRIAGHFTGINREDLARAEEKTVQDLICYGILKWVKKAEDETTAEFVEKIR